MGGFQYPVIDMLKTGETIRKKMEQADVSVQDVREALSFTNTHGIYSWLRGTSLPSIDNLYALSELLAVPMDSLITGNRKKKFSWDMVQEDCE